MSRVGVTVIGSLPLVNGISPYTSHLRATLTARPDVGMELIGFRHLHPRWLYRAGDPAEASGRPPCVDGVTIRNDWYNPLSWLRTEISPYYVNPGGERDVVSWSPAGSSLGATTVWLATFVGCSPLRTTEGGAEFE